MISSYLIANEETARRGIVLSFAPALLQSLVAIVLVGLGGNSTAALIGVQRRARGRIEARPDRAG